MQSIVHLVLHNTHEKNKRNQLLTSDGSKKAARQFFDMYKHLFAWGTVIAQESRTTFPLLTDLAMGYVYPDIWNKMSVKLSKSISSQRTLSEGFSHLSNELGCFNQIAPEN